MNIGGRSILIRKRTAVWLHNDGERVSSDRIFCVRSKQPNETDSLSKLTCSSPCSTKVQQNTPISFDHIVVGDFCVFNTGTAPKIGKALQFIKYDINGKKIQYNGNYATVGDNYGLLCTWYTVNSMTRQCVMTETSNEYVSIKEYKGTLTTECIEKDTNQTAKQLGFTPTLLSVPNKFTITLECNNFITFICTSSENSLPPPTASLPTPTTNDAPITIPDDDSKCKHTKKYLDSNW